jgi:TonB family protein
MALVNKQWHQSDWIGLGATAVIHLLVLAAAMLMNMDSPQQQRTSFIEVTLGEYKSGTLAEYSQEKNKQVATRPTPSETPTEEPETEQEPTEQKQTPTADEETKPVDLPDQQEEVDEPEVTTPEVEETDPKEQQKEASEEQTEVAPEARKAEETQEGAETSGDVRGAKGDPNAAQGTGNDQDKSAPYELKWEGNIERAPQVQPMPSYSAEVEAVITVRFQVKPDGTVGRIIPLKKMNPELEREVISTLRSWRFSQLPSGVPQKAQWGTITFRFVFD